MGNSFFKKQITSIDALNQNRSEQSSLKESKRQVSRADFNFLFPIYTSGLEQQSVTWLVQARTNKNEKFFIKQTNKLKIYNHKRIQQVHNELQILTKQRNPFFIQTYFSFQDYQYLYLVEEALEAFTLDEILNHHRFTEEETKYVVRALISVIQQVHSIGLALVQLSPKNILIDKRSGKLKIFQFLNTALIDSFYESSIVADVCPYSAPQVLLKDKILAQSDYFSLGLIMYQMMKQKAVKLKEGEFNYNRRNILNDSIDIEASDLPEGWNSEAIHFLVKLTIKNPSLRLGRYGSFEVSNHPWLKNFQQNEAGVNLKESYFSQKKNKKVNFKLQQSSLNPKDSIFIRNYSFQDLFSKYEFKTVQKKEDLIYQALTISKNSFLSNDSYIKLKPNVI